MPMPNYDPEEPPMIGFFMVGAYQEILGNMHNLFGDTAAIDVYIDKSGIYKVKREIRWRICSITSSLILTCY